MERLARLGRRKATGDRSGADAPVSGTQGIPKDAILVEEEAEDTIGNIYYLKKFLKSHVQYKSVLLFCATQREARIRFLVDTFFGPNHQVAICPTPDRHHERNALGSEDRLLHEQKAFLKIVRPGHDEDVGPDLYAKPYYRNQARAIARKKVKIGPVSR